RHHFNGATGETKGHGPDRILPEPVHGLVERGHDDAFGWFLAKGDLAHSLQVVLTANQIQKTPCTAGFLCGFEHMNILAFKTWMRKLRFGLTAETRRRRELVIHKGQKSSRPDEQPEITRLRLAHSFNDKIIDVVSPDFIRSFTLRPILGAFCKSW